MEEQSKKIISTLFSLIVRIFIDMDTSTLKSENAQKEKKTTERLQLF